MRQGTTLREGMVRCGKDHECANCGRPIPIGDDAFVVVTLDRSAKRNMVESWYVCHCSRMFRR